MNQVLATLTKMGGVSGALVLDGSGACLASQLTPPYEQGFMTATLARLQAVFDVFASVDSGSEHSFSLSCEDGGLVMRRADSRTLVALTERSANLNMLSVAMNVAVLSLSRLQVVPSNDVRLAPLETYSSHLTTSASGEGASPVPPDAVDRLAVQQLLRVYREFMGPAAKLVFKQELGGLGVSSRTLRKGQLGDFTVRLAQRIPTPARQQEFTLAVRELRGRLAL